MSMQLSQDLDTVPYPWKPGVNCLTPAFGASAAERGHTAPTARQQEDSVYLGTGYTVLLTYAIQKTLIEQEHCQEV